MSNISILSTDDQQEQENTTEQSKSYTYELYRVFNQSEKLDLPQISAKLADFFKTKHNAENIIYPTHDHKCYVYFKTSNFLRFKKLNLSEIEIDNGQITLKLYEYINSGISQYGYFKLRDDEMNGNVMGEKFFEKRFGVCMVDFNEGNKQLKLLKLDSYQKELLDNSLAPSPTSPIKNNTSNNNNKHRALTNKLKLILYDRSHLIYEYESKDVRIEIDQGNLLEQEVEVIVNAANTELVFGGGVAGYIRQKCGRVIDDECKTYLKQRGCKMSISEVMHTKAYGLNDTCKHIIHACGPRWSDYSSKNKCFNDLKNTFFNVLIYTETKLKNASSIAIPLISSGIFGVPRSVCCQALFCAVNEYLAESLDENRKLKLIKLTNIDKETCNDLLNYFNDNLNFESVNNEKRIIDKNDDKLNRTVSLKKDVAYKTCCICEAKVKSTLRKECGCEYCIDCREMMEQGCDNICQSRKCKKKEDNK